MLINIEDLRQRARRRLPKAVFEYVESGAEDGYTLNANRRGFERYLFRALDPLPIKGRSEPLTTFVPGAKITQVHGEPVEVGGRTVLPLFHPAAALRAEPVRAALEADVDRLPALLERLRAT